MRIAVIGAGAIGSLLAAWLLEQGSDETSLLARGDRLDSLRRNGLVVNSRGRLLQSRPVATDDPARLGPQDALLMAVKGYSLAQLAPRLGPLLGDDTVIVSAQNGIPWWYFYGAGPREAWQPFQVVDPEGAAWRSLGPERAIGCVINAAAEIDPEGVVTHGGNLRLTLGAPRHGDHAARVTAIAAAFAAGGIDVGTTPDIRAALWTKLQANLASAPIGVLTGAAMGPIIGAPGMRALRGRLMHECRAVASAWGVELPDDIEERLDQPSAAPDHKPSMLQDYEAGRPIELDAQVTAIVELAHQRDVPVPITETLLSLVRLRIAA